MPNNEKFDLLIRYLSGEVTPAEKETVEKWLRSDPAHLGEFKDLKAIWDVSGKTNIQVDANKAWQRITQESVLRNGEVSKRESVADYYYQRKHSSLHSTFGQALRIAAVLIILIGIGYLFLSKQSATMTEDAVPTTREVITERGQRAQIRFSDGTLVTLNSMSVLRFPERFSNEAREVYLSGEAYFEVTEGEKPFIVIAEDAVVKVLGTAFNVQAWPADQWVDVVVAEGSVSVKSESTPQSEWIVLQEKYRSRILKGVGPTPPEKVDLKMYVAWLSGKLMFENVPFIEVLNQLERRYDVTFVVKDTDLYTRRLTASLKDETIMDVLSLFRLTLNVNCELMDSVVVISSSTD
jgi:transmembrane sensor